MPSENSVVYLRQGNGSLPAFLGGFCHQHRLRPLLVDSAEVVLSLVNRSYPGVIVLDGREGAEEALALCGGLKGDAFTAIVPVVLLSSPESGDLAARGLEAGADEVLTLPGPERENNLRLEVVLRRAARDVSVHPTTRLPGTIRIEREIADRLDSGQPFAVCYADIDSFKEFNDRYGYNHGDRVILLLSKILRDLVRALAPGGFVGHIGGDDFIYIVDLQHLELSCDEIIRVFDELIPFQYSAEDRRAGYFVGKDRRGTIYRVPLMTLSIGVVTNQRQRFEHTAQVSELAAEMKGYAKSLPGSVYVVDRRNVPSEWPLGPGGAQLPDE